MIFKLQNVQYYGGGNKLRYALIGLAPYTFHYDLSKCYLENFRLLRYFMAFNDLHNFWLSPAKYTTLFNEKFLSFQPPPMNFNENRSPENTPVHFMNYQERFDSRERVEIWSRKNYPETREENIKILDDYLTLCEENHIIPIMFLPPMTECYSKHFNKQMLDEYYYLVEQAGKKHSSAGFVDGWKLQFFTDADFRDVDHLNIVGAAKFSAFMNNLIEQIESNGSFGK